MDVKEENTDEIESTVQRLPRVAQRVIKALGWQRDSQTVGQPNRALYVCDLVTEGREEGEQKYWRKGGRIKVVLHLHLGLRHPTMSPRRQRMCKTIFPKKLKRIV